MQSTTKFINKCRVSVSVKIFLMMDVNDQSENNEDVSQPFDADTNVSTKRLREKKVCKLNIILFIQLMPLFILILLLTNLFLVEILKYCDSHNNNASECERVFGFDRRIVKESR